MYKKSNYISDKDFINKNLDLSKVKESESIMKFVFEKNKKIVFLIDIDEFSNIKKIIEDSRLLIEEVFPDKVVFEREFRQ